MVVVVFCLFYHLFSWYIFSASFTLPGLSLQKIVSVLMFLLPIIKSMTMFRGIAFAGFRFSIHLKHKEYKTRIGQRYWHFFLLPISINVAHVLQKAAIKRQQQVCTTIISSNYHFKPKVHRDLPYNNY